ncbi:uncharacterized protein LOC110678914 [Aedes aegypti]|uniref:Uncharacterized protein n=1 Tax=Aedes aegypti TaxID=7159 RepID=A0A6I8U4J8_AEDAE|nr:uncharacterized protein LOC110678914 [Aedes aegypti]
MAKIVVPLLLLMVFVPIVYSYPQNVDFGRKDVTSEPVSNNVVRKDFFILEIPEEAIEDEIEEQMIVMMERRAKQQLALDGFILKLYEEFKKREQEGTLNADRQNLLKGK